MKILVRLRLRGCQLEFVEHFGPGIVAIVDIEIDPLAKSVEDVLPAIKAHILERLFDIEYLVEAPQDNFSLDLQRFDEKPAVIYVQ